MEKQENYFFHEANAYSINRKIEKYQMNKGENLLIKLLQKQNQLYTFSSEFKKIIC